MIIFRLPEFINFCGYQLAGFVDIQPGFFLTEKGVSYCYDPRDCENLLDESDGTAGCLDDGWHAGGGTMETGAETQEGIKTLMKRAGAQIDRKRGS